jgi:hypothetical protein
MPLRKPKWERDYVFAVATCGTALANGLSVHLYAGDVWPTDDPIVLERPDLFSNEPTKLCRTTRDPASKPAL